MSLDTKRVDAPWPSYALPFGTTVNGYRIERVLGSGGFGVTYLARDLLTQAFAIKEYYPRQFATRQNLTVLAASDEDSALFEECRERFLREAQALVLLSRAAGASDGIVRVQTYFEAHGTCFLVMDYVEGTSLANVLRQEPGGLDADRVRSILHQLLTCIRVVHRAGLMHRDIKPANIILRDDDRVVLIDFGSSRPAARGDTTSYTQIYSGGYAPPEQMLGLPQGEFSDIYAIGAVSYRAIGGTVVDAMARQGALAAGRQDPQAPAAQIGSGRYPSRLLAAIDAALATDPERRPQDVDAMLAALGPAEPAEDATIIAPRRAVPPEVPRPRRAVWGVAAGVGALALIGAAWFVLRGPTTPAGVHDVAAVTPAPTQPPPIAANRQEATRPAELAPPTAAQPPQREAAAVPPPTATNAPPDSPPTGTSASPQAAPDTGSQEAAAVPSPPAPPPQREAIVVPPPTPVPAPAPSPGAPASPLETAQAAARSLPCSAVNVASGQDGMRVSGLAPAGPELDRLLTGISGSGRVADDVTRIDRFACTAIATVSALARPTSDITGSTFGLQLDQREVASGARLGIDVASTLPAVYVDLYQSDGSVRHLLRPAPSGAATKPHLAWVATPPAGQRLIVALGSATPLDLGTRPATERATDYLDALQTRLQQAAVPPVADLAMVIVRPAEPVAKLPQPRPTSLRSDRCANIVSRAQMGENLSDAELAALRTECRS